MRQADQIRSDFAIIEDELEAIHKRLGQLPTRNEVWRAAMLGMLGGAVAAVTLIEALKLIQDNTGPVPFAIEGRNRW